MDICPDTICSKKSMDKEVHVHFFVLVSSETKRYCFRLRVELFTVNTGDSSQSELSSYYYLPLLAINKLVNVAQMSLK